MQTHKYRIVIATTIPSTKCVKLFLPWFSTLHLELWGTVQSCHRKNPLRWDSREEGLQTESSSWRKTWMSHMGTTPGLVILGMLTWEFHCVIVLKLECQCKGETQDVCILKWIHDSMWLPRLSWLTWLSVFKTTQQERSNSVLNKHREVQGEIPMMQT